MAGVRLDQPTPVDIDAEVDRFRAAAQLERSAAGAAGDDADGPDDAEATGEATASTEATEGAAAEADAPAAPEPVDDGGGSSPAPTDAAAGDNAGSGGDPPPDTSTETSPSAPAEPGLSRRPDAGVYTYETDGYHEVEVLRSRNRHDYPAATSLTLRHTDCGLEGRWDVLDERWETVESCVADRSSALHRITIYHEFYGRGERRRYGCDDTTVLYPASERVGERWSGRCASDDTVIDIAATLVDRTEVTVDGRAVEALHVRFTSTFRGDLEGRQQLDRWLEVGTGLELRATAELDVEGGSGVDRFRLEERYERVLTSREPRR